MKHVVATIPLIALWLATASCLGQDSKDSGEESETEGPECTPDDEPVDCYDQGPGQCGDATAPATCVDGEWSCPGNWALGGYGPDCCFEPGC